MRNVWKFFTLIVFLLITPWFSGAQAQSVERALTQLRGTWEYHTFYKKWKLTFLSDEDLIRNNEDVKYSLTPEAITITDNGKTETFAYIIEEEKLSLTDRSGATMTYDYQRPGETEQTIDGIFYGIFYSETDSAQLSIFTFKEGRSVSFTDGHNINVRGIYRIENNTILMKFDDERADKAIIRFRDNDGNADGIFFYDELFSKDRPIVEDIPREHRPYAPPLTGLVPVCTLRVPPPTFPEPPSPPVIPSSYIPPPPVPVDNGSRDFGSTRGETTSRDNNTGTRSGEHRP